MKVPKERKMSPAGKLLQESISYACGTDPRSFIPDPERAIILARHAAEANERDMRVREERETTVGEALEKLMARLKARFGGRPATTDEECEANEWKTVTAPHLVSLGLSDRHVRRIAPNWGNAAQEKAYREVSALCNLSGAVVALIGSRGVGKTTIAAQLMRTRVDARRAHFQKDIGERAMFDPPEAGRYVKLGEIGGMFKPLYADFGTIEHTALTQRLEAWLDLDLLVIDEVHESEDLKTHARLLTDLVDQRYARRNDTILISNHDGPDFRRLINPSILSRIGEHGKIIECRWKSWRAL